MKLRYILFSSIITSIVLMIGCLEKEQKNVSQNDSIILSNNASELVEPISIGEAKAKIDCLEKLFNNENFYFIKQKDTQFVYFTRLNDLSIFTHSYKMINGDSTQLIIDTIIANSQNQIVWNWKGNYLKLDSVTNKTARWLYTTTNAFIEFNKNIQGEILFNDTKGSTIKLHKTPQISLFLSRSFYDYKNGTHYAFDTTNFTKK